jgi:tRNA-Thr(GGU) m(6)t(6)A37 methyltransferase TsaA
MSDDPIVIQPIGYVRHTVPDAEVPLRRAEIIAELHLFDRYCDALDGIDAYSHLFVLFWMDRVVSAEFSGRVHPRGRADLPLTGVLATRGRQHPNPIGLAVVELLKREASCLHVRRLDAYSGSPIIDIKPYDAYDVFTDIRLPEWWRRLRPGI